MRINRYVALCNGLSRRAADQAVAQGYVKINGARALPGNKVQPSDRVTLNGQTLHRPTVNQTIILNKPAGYVVSRKGQGFRTIYDLLQPSLHTLKPVGRLDKNSSGLLLLTDDGQLNQELTHPRYAKEKIYEVGLDKPLAPDDKIKIEHGVALEDGISKFTLELKGTWQATRADKGRTLDSQIMAHESRVWQATLAEGRNRQIRRTFAKLNYNVTYLHRTQFGDFRLPPDLKEGRYKPLENP